MKEELVRKVIIEELRKYFHFMNENEVRIVVRRYRSVKDVERCVKRIMSRNPPPSDYNWEVLEMCGTRQRANKRIIGEVQRKVARKLGLAIERRIRDTNFSIDLYDERERICYEIALGDGSEIFKDIIKALLINAKKLVIFTRSYPNPWGMTGFNYMRNQWKQLKGRVGLNVEIVEFMTGIIYS